MSCRRAYELDLAAYLADPRDEAFADFRAHYPRCAACAAEVRAWTELDLALRGGDHPEPARLLARADTPQRLDPAERAALDAHLQGCASCRDELAALADFDPEALRAGAVAPAATGEADADARGPLGRALAGLRWLVVQPAFAYALALLLAAPTLVRLAAGPEPPAAPAATVAQEAARADREDLAREPAPTPRAATPQRKEARDAAEGDADAARAPARPRAFLPDETALRGDAPAPAAPEAAPPRDAAPGEARQAAAGGAERGPAPVTEPLRTLGYAENAEAAEEAATLETEAFADAADSGLVAERQRRSSDALHKSERAAPAALAPVPLPGGGFAVEVPATALPAPPPDAGRGRPVELRLVSPDGRREVVERFAPGEPWVVEVPGAWAAPGTWRARLRAGGAERAFAVRVPGPAAP